MLLMGMHFKMEKKKDEANSFCRIIKSLKFSNIICLFYQIIEVNVKYFGVLYYLGPINAIYGNKQQTLITHLPLLLTQIQE